MMVEERRKQAFINYYVSYTNFCAHKSILGACPCKWVIVNVKDMFVTNNNMIQW